MTTCKQISVQTIVDFLVNCPSDSEWSRLVNTQCCTRFEMNALPTGFLRCGRRVVPSGKSVFFIETMKWEWELCFGYEEINLFSESNENERNRSECACHEQAQRKERTNEGESSTISRVQMIMLSFMRAVIYYLAVAFFSCTTDETLVDLILSVCFRTQEMISKNAASILHPSLYCLIVFVLRLLPVEW